MLHSNFAVGFSDNFSMGFAWTVRLGRQWRQRRQPKQYIVSRGGDPRILAIDRSYKMCSKNYDHIPMHILLFLNVEAKDPPDPPCILFWERRTKCCRLQQWSRLILMMFKARGFRIVVSTTGAISCCRSWETFDTWSANAPNAFRMAVT